jgi:hypothetical protein
MNLLLPPEIVVALCHRHTPSRPRRSPGNLGLILSRITRQQRPEQVNQDCPLVARTRGFLDRTRTLSLVQQDHKPRLITMTE